MKKVKKEGVTISIAADILGVSLRTLRVWDKNGILETSRSKNGYRQYLISDLERFKQKKNLPQKNKRMSLGL